MIGVTAASLAAALVGCQHFVARQSELPSQTMLIHDQLVIYTDFPLPPKHRMLEELADERRELLSKLALPPSEEPIHVYLFETNEAFRKFIARFYPNFPDRRAFFMQSDTRLAVYAHWGDRIAEDLRHEVAHGYLHSVVPHIALWLDEGLAEYAETPPGTAGINAAHVQSLAEELAAGRWRPHLERLEQLDNMAGMSQLEYAEAWAWVHWMLEDSQLTRDELRAHLDDVREGRETPPLSVRLREQIESPEASLVEHVRLLAEQTPHRSKAGL